MPGRTGEQRKQEKNRKTKVPSYPGVAQAPDAEASGEEAGGSQLPTKKKPGARKSRIVQVLEQLGPARARKRSERGTCINTVETGIPPQE